MFCITCAEGSIENEESRKFSFGYGNRFFDFESRLCDRWFGRVNVFVIGVFKLAFNYKRAKNKNIAFEKK